MWRLNIENRRKFNFNKRGIYWVKSIEEIDIVAIYNIDKNLIIGEFKYSKAEKGLHVLHLLGEKAEKIK